MLTRFSIVTLVFFTISIVLVIRPVSFSIRLPWVGRRKLSLDLLTAPILTIAILWASQCLGPKQIRDGIVGVDNVKPYNILILFFSLAYMAITLDIAGVFQAAAFWVSNQGGSSGWRLYLYFYLMLTFLSVLLGNDPVILSGTVFLIYYTTATGLEPLPWLIAEFAVANTGSMVLFFCNLTNVVICEGFRINNVAFSAYTILPFLGCVVSCYGALVFQFRGPNHIPKKLEHTTYLDPRGVLHDPVGAWVGGFLLGGCLVVMIVVSFFHVDVWMVTLPFAVAKAIWDLGWDHYRYVTGRLPRLGERMETAGDASGNVDGEDKILSEMKRAMGSAPQPEAEKSKEALPTDVLSTDVLPTDVLPTDVLPTDVLPTDVLPTDVSAQPSSTPASTLKEQVETKSGLQNQLRSTYRSLSAHFPTFFTAIPRLPFALAPFSFCQFILIEALERHGWIDVFARWLQIASKGGQIHPTVWLVGVLGVILCNIAGTNIGATILLTKIVRAAELSGPATRAAGVSLAVASNIGAPSFTFSASLAGLLWHSILRQKKIKMKQTEFAYWNMLPILVMTGVGLGIVSAEMAVLYP